jgi:hypothetical protein
MEYVVKNFNLDTFYKARETGVDLDRLAVRIGRLRPEDDYLSQWTWYQAHDHRPCCQRTSDFTNVIDTMYAITSWIMRQISHKDANPPSAFWPSISSVTLKPGYDSEKFG